MSYLFLELLNIYRPELLKKRKIEAEGRYAASVRVDVYAPDLTLQGYQQRLRLGLLSAVSVFLPPLFSDEVKHGNEKDAGAARRVENAPLFSPRVPALQSNMQGCLC